MSMLRTLWSVMRKELLDLFRDRKTVSVALLMGPLLFPALVIGIGAMSEKRARTQLESTLELPVIGAEHAPNLVRFLASQNMQVLPAPEDPNRSVREQDHDVVLRIRPAYGEQWRDSRPAAVELIYDSSRQDSRIPVDRLRLALEQYGRQVGALRGINRGVSPQLGNALTVAQRDVASPDAKRSMVLGIMLPYFLVLSAFLGGAYLVIDVTAGERERQSLEPLLATPSARGAIMSGKVLAACAFGMLTLALSLLALKLGFSLAPRRIQTVDMSFLAIGQLLLVLLPMVLLGTTLLTLISASVKSVKEAQSYMSVLMLLPMLPTIVLLVNPVKDELWQFAVPFLAQNQLLLRLIRNEWIAPAEWAVYLGAGFGLGIVLWAAAARLYHREKLAISA